MSTIAIPASWGHLTTRLRGVHVLYDAATGSPTIAEVAAAMVDDSGTVRGTTNIAYNYANGQIASDGIVLVTANGAQQTTATNGVNLFSTMMDAALAATVNIIRQ